MRLRDRAGLLWKWLRRITVSQSRKAATLFSILFFFAICVDRTPVRAFVSGVNINLEDSRAVLNRSHSCDTELAELERYPNSNFELPSSEFVSWVKERAIEIIIATPVEIGGSGVPAVNHIDEISHPAIIGARD